MANDKQEEIRAHLATTRERREVDRKNVREARSNTEARGEMRTERCTTINQPRRTEPVRTRRRDSPHLILSADVGARSQQHLNARRVTVGGSPVESSLSGL